MQIHTVMKFMRIALGIIFLWFGMLKFFSGVSPAEMLATMTIEKLFFGVIPAQISIKLLAIWEVLIGVGFLSGKYFKVYMPLFFIHMILTFSPFVLLPELCFTDHFFGLTLIGQYIMKNLLFIAVGLLFITERKEKEAAL